MDNWDDIKDRILNETDITEVIGQYVRLQKRGVNFLGLCPFHNEKTPSFTVSPDKGIYKCFGCGKSGNVITFLIDFAGMTYQEAIKDLAEQNGIQLPEKQAQSKKFKEKLTQKDLILKALDVSSKYYQKCLKTNAGLTAKQYIDQRGFTHDTVKEFILGYSPDSWDSLYNELKGLSYTENTLMNAGLIIKNEKGDGYYDRFRDRLMFPIQNPLGKIIGFGARILNNDINTAKYLNSPQTDVYDKSKILFGLFQAKNEIRTMNFAIMTEGYADVISLHQGGFRNTVSSSGTALTFEQLNLLHKYTNRIFFVYDADSAGISATMRGIELSLEHDFDVMVVPLPSGEDPDSIIRNYGSEVFENYLNDAITFLDYKYDIYKKQNLLQTPSGKAKAIMEIIKLITKIPNRLQHDDYITRLSSKFGLTHSQLEEVYKQKERLESTKLQPIINDREKENINKNSDTSTVLMEHIDIDDLLSEEHLIISSIVLNSNVIDYIRKDFKFDTDKMFTTTGKNLLKIVMDLSEKSTDIIKLINSENIINDSIKEYINSIVFERKGISANWKNFSKNNIEFDIFQPLKDAISKLELKFIESEMTEIKNRMKDLNQEESMTALIRMSDLSKRRMELQENFNLKNN